MADTVQEFFANLESRADPAKTAGMSNSYLFDIEGAGQWKVDVDDGSISVSEGDGDADATIPGDVREDRRRRSEPHERLHDGEAEDQGRHGRRDEAAEAVLGAPPFGVQARPPPVDTDGVSDLLRAIGLRRRATHRSVPVRTLRRWKIISQPRHSS